MLKKAVVVSLALIVVLTVTACSGEQLPSAEEIVAGILESGQNVETYQIDTNMEMDMTIEAEDETHEIHLSMYYGGAIDVKNLKMKILMDIQMMSPELDEVEIAETLYLIDNMMYMYIDMPGLIGNPLWIKGQMPEDILCEMDQVESLTALVETAQITVLDSEIVNGVDCYVVEVVPDADLLWEYVSQQLIFFGKEIEIPNIAVDIILEMYDHITLTYYIAKDTHFIIRSSLDMFLELTPEDLGFPDEEGSMRIDATVDMIAHDYNQPVSIELPPEAEDAVEIPSGEMFW